MYKWGYLLILITVLLLPFPAHAQEQITLNSLEIDIWPEYDRHSVLIIYRITLSTDTPLPADLSIRIPASSDEPNAVAYRQMDGTLWDITDYSRQLSGIWAYIRFTTPSRELQLEYYDTSLEREEDARLFSFLWPGDYAVTAMNIQVQQPLGATDMVISPSLGSGAAGNDGLIYYSADIGSIPAGQTVEISLGYNKTTDSLSAESLNVQPSAPIPQNTAGDFQIENWMPWALGFIGAGLIVGGVLWYWQTGKQRPLSFKHRKRTRPPRREQDASPNGTDDNIYCHQCGKRAQPGDAFCRSCGTRLRVR